MPVTPAATFDLTLADCCDRWGISRNAVKSRAAALGVELRRESSTRTVWPGEDLDVGDRLHEHLRRGGTLANFPESLPSPAASSDRRSAASLAPAGGGTDRGGGLSVVAAGGVTAEAVAAIVLAAREALPVDPLAVPRALAAAADEGLPLTTAELAGLLGESVEALEQRSGSSTLRGFRLERRGRGDGRAWYVSRAQPRPRATPAPSEPMPSLPAAGGGTDGRPVGFAAALDVEWRDVPAKGSRIFAMTRLG